jgi:hypothetical protein
MREAPGLSDDNDDDSDHAEEISARYTGHVFFAAISARRTKAVINWTKHLSVPQIKEKFEHVKVHYFKHASKHYIFFSEQMANSKRTELQIEERLLKPLSLGSAIEKGVVSDPSKYLLFAPNLESNAGARENHVPVYTIERKLSNNPWQCFRICFSNQDREYLWNRIDNQNLTHFKFKRKDTSFHELIQNMQDSSTDITYDVGDGTLVFYRQES